MSDEKDPIKETIENESEMFEGDIYLNPEQAALIANGTNDENIRSLRASSRKRKWQKIGSIVPIPYILSSSYTSSERATIARAFTEFKRKTCIR